MAELTAVAIAPVLICAIYIFIRDKYEKEPIRLLILGVLFGALMTVPIIHTENFVTLYVPNRGFFAEIFFLTFIVAALVEEFYKFIVLFFLVWRNHNFNERFDGIVYGAFISLGFAGLENIMYVFNPTLGGLSTGFSRAIFSVPGHAIFGITMGYYFSMIKFEPEKKALYTFLSFFVPWFLHGTYNFILMSEIPYMMIVFVGFVGLLWILGFRKMKKHIERSPFKVRV